MKWLIAGGFLFVGGCILYAIGTIGYANTIVQAYMMRPPIYIGIVAMLVGAALGLVELLKKD